MLKRLRGQNDNGKRVVALVQQLDSNGPILYQSLGQHTLMSEQYAQVLALLSKQNMEVTTNVPTQHTSYLASKSFYLLTAQPKLSWIIDSGATDHITPHLHLFSSFTPVEQECFITMPNGRKA